jgi:hypothetical protein
VNLSQVVPYHRNVVATPRAVSLLGLSKFPAFDPKGAAPQVIIWVTWHPWWIRSGDGSPPRVTRGPFYNISCNNYELVAKLPSSRFFIIENRVVAIALAPYLNFDENVIYEMDDVDGLVIYERYFLEFARDAPKI